MTSSINCLGMLSRSEAAQRVRELYGISCEASSLAKYATVGTGPIYRLIGGRAMYWPEDVDAWAASLVGPPIRRASETLTGSAASQALGT